MAVTTKSQSTILREQAMQHATDSSSSLGVTVEDRAARARAANDLMRAAAMAFEMETRQGPESFDGVEALAEMSGLLMSLWQTFAGADSPQARRFAGQIRAVLERHGAEFPE